MNPFVSFEIQSRLVLASASPRRHGILKSLGFDFEVVRAVIDEGAIDWGCPESGVSILAELKAVEGQQVRPRKIIIGADTIVVCEGKVMGKPKDPDDAAHMLRSISGRRHEVITAVAVIAPPNIRFVEAEKTSVYFRELESGEIARYIESGESSGKAGAYAIQGYASAFVERIDGCYFNVVGLPVFRLMSIFKRLEQRIESRGIRR